MLAVNTKMAKVQILTSILMICLLIQSIQAVSFECDDEPRICKTKFGTQFEKEFKEIHLTATRKLLTTYIDNANELLAQLSLDDSHAAAIRESINVVKKSLDKLNDNPNDSKKISEAINEAMNGMTWDFSEQDLPEHLKNNSKLQEMRQSLVNVMRELGRSTGNLWVELYSGLRDKDLKAYPEYLDINKQMEILRGNGPRPAKGSDYSHAAEILGDKFDLPYFQLITDIS